MFRLFIDETGHDHLKSSNKPEEQHLCLMGVILTGRGHRDLTERMNALKLDAFGTINVVLHRREIIDRKPPFDTLNDPVIRERFNEGLMGMIRESEYVALASLIDKQAHLAKYRVWHYQPYHYCLAVLLERYVMWLKDRGGRGDVMAEWRGVKPNMRLENSYNRLFRVGTENVRAEEMQSHLSSGQIKIQKKEANIAGLQLADLIVNPARREIICGITKEEMKAPFGREVVRILREQKYRRGPGGVIEGYGIKLLP
jgi:hypothetical protein